MRLIQMGMGTGGVIKNPIKVWIEKLGNQTDDKIEQRDEMKEEIKTMKIKHKDDIRALQQELDSIKVKHGVQESVMMDLEREIKKLKK